MARTRDYRRHQDTRTKAHARKVATLWNARSGYQPGEVHVTDARVGRLASTGCRPCNCALCVMQDDYPSRREVRSRVNFREQLAALLGDRR